MNPRPCPMSAEHAAIDLSGGAITVEREAFNPVETLFSLLDRTITVIEKQTELITNQITHMGNELDDYIAAQKAANERISAALEGVTGDVARLKELIEQLTAGEVSNDQKAALQELSATAGSIVSKLEALDAENVPEGNAGAGGAE